MQVKTIETIMNIITAYTDTGISLGQITVDSKNNEIPAVQELIEIKHRRKGSNS